MASSSTSSVHKSFKYEVFLSFRGEDTRKNFVDHLYDALQRKSILTYKDDLEIKKGERISDELLGSIENSKFYIIVFSKDYASSSWCLDELVKIMECRKMAEHTAYPIFYDVEPTEIRKQIGVVGKAFAKHEKEVAAGKWRNALKEAADLAGWELKKTADGHESKFIQKIVEEISLELRSINFSIDEKLVGMETRVNDVISFLETGIDDVRMIGIKGMGGGGKTTLARAVFDQISFQFEGKSFVENVREVSNDSLSGLKSLQNQLLSDVLNDKGISVSSVYDGKNMLKRRMSGRKVLLVLDDVDHIDQLEALAGEPNWFKPGSRIIITTRYEQVLVAHRVKLIHNVNLLSDKEAICLFSRYAFGREIPIQGYEKLSGEVVRYASGLPLTIKVLGSFLCGKDESEWIDALERLKTIPLHETLKRLELSYISLEEDYKEIFLNVACLLKGWAKADAIEALESCGLHARNGLRVLEQKSLITINNYERVDMHDHIEEMGRDIVRRSHPANKHSRLWKEDEIEDILINDLGTEATICMKIYKSKLNPEIVMKGLRKMKDLKFLEVSLENFNSNQETNKLIPNLVNALGFLCCIWKFNKVNLFFPDTLRYLHWDQYPFRTLPQTFQANNLVALKIAGSEILQLWEWGERKVCNKLRFLDLSNSQLKTLDLGLTPNLETLTLERCCALIELSDSICMLKHLKSLKLDGCSLLEKLPEDLGLLESLVKLSLSYTEIKHLPDSICMLKHLKFLKLDRCSLLEKLPEHLGQLESLEKLNLSYTEITHLPDSICMLKNLKYLDLNECSLLEKLPEDLGLLESLQYLELSGTMIKHLPCSICTLKHLKYIGLHRCSLFEKLPEDLGGLECLERIILRSTKIKHLPDSICMLKHLELLPLNDCLLLEKLPEDLGRLECLEMLNLSSTKIKHLPDSICMLKHLKHLVLYPCLLLEKLPEDLGQLGCLEYLNLSSTKIKLLPDSICTLKHLKYLKLDKCLLLEKLPEDLGLIECLESLDLSNTMIKHLPDSICMLKHMKTLDLYRCSFLDKLPKNLGRLECLEYLNLSSTKIKHLPCSICMLKGLKYLKLDKCSLFEKLPEDLGRLECIKSLDLSNTMLKHLPDSICMLKHLESLKLIDCSLLETLPEDLGLLECLEELHIEGTCISHLPQSIILLKGLCIYGSRGLLQSFGFTSDIQISGDGMVCYVKV
ncbi:hypothetical protein Lser_V15G45031 [Lactuca serriola]